MVKAVNKFKTAEFLAQQALKAAKAAARQTEQSVLTQPLGLIQTAQTTASKQGSKQTASKGHKTDQTISVATAPAIAQPAARKLHVAHQTEAAAGRHATALLTEQLASTRNKRGFNTSALEPGKGSKHDHMQAKKPKLAKSVAVPTIFAAPAPQGTHCSCIVRACLQTVVAGQGSCACSLMSAVRFSRSQSFAQPTVLLSLPKCSALRLGTSLLHDSCQCMTHQCPADNAGGMLLHQ